MGYELVEVTSEEEWRDFHAIRRAVLWEARGLNGYNDRHVDDHLPGHHPLLLTWAGRPVGTVRLDEVDDRRAAVRLVAVSEQDQGLGHGRALMGLTEPYAARLGIGTLLVYASANATAFYEKVGWHPFDWDPAGRVGIMSDCTQMQKQIAALSV